MRSQASQTSAQLKSKNFWGSMRERSTAPHRGANRSPRATPSIWHFVSKFHPLTPPTPSTRGGETAVVPSNLAGKQVWFFCTVVFWEIFKKGLGGKDRWATCKVVHGAASGRSGQLEHRAAAVHTLAVWAVQLSTELLPPWCLLSVFEPVRGPRYKS